MGALNMDSADEIERGYQKEVRSVYVKVYKKAAIAIIIIMAVIFVILQVSQMSIMSGNRMLTTISSYMILYLIPVVAIILVLWFLKAARKEARKTQRRLMETQMRILREQIRDEVRKELGNERGGKGTNERAEPLKTQAENIRL
jgi:flagellar biosynthesis protein FlhB